MSPTADAGPAGLDTFVTGGDTPSTSTYRTEGPALFVDFDVAVAIRVADRIVLVRSDVPDGFDWARRGLEQGLAGLGLRRLDDETVLGTVVALQVLGLRPSEWDLWGDDVDAAFAALRAAAVGEP